jgi:hypothetical protein
MCEISVCVFLPPSLLCFSLVPRSLPPSFSYRPLSTYSLQATALNEVCPHVSSSRIGGRAARGVSGEVFVRRQPSVSLSSKPERCVSGIANENPTDRKCRVRSLAGRFSGVSLACRGAVAGVPGDGTLYRRNIHNFCLVSDTAERSYYIQGRPDSLARIRSRKKHHYTCSDRRYTARYSMRYSLYLVAHIKA